MRILLGCLLYFVTVVCWSAPVPQQAKHAFIQKMVTAHGFDRQQLAALMSSITPNQTILNMMAPTPRAKPSAPMVWYRYRDSFITPSMIKRGRVFWQKHKATLQRAAKQYQVAPAIIVATLGVETRYGRVTGGFSVLQALYTLAFYVPRRAVFFQHELAQFLLLARRYHIDSHCIKGSFAGAIGPAQFMPSSLLHYAEGDSLHSCRQPVSVDQAIRDVAHYYHEHGWRFGKPVAIQATIRGGGYGELPVQHFKSRMTVGQLKHYGVMFDVDLPANTKASVFPLLAKQGLQYWLTLHNFYVITRYNKSLFYAMAVYQLGQALK